jgi:nitrogen fixation protein NifZ
MQTRFDLGAQVRVTRNVRNDGTYPGLSTGDVLVRCGTAGNVVDIGVFLQDQIIYSVHFLDIDRLVGCREEELIAADEPWVPSRFETRDKVIALKTLAVNGEIRALAGAVGEVIKVLRDASDGVQYHVRFSERVLQIPEATLAAIDSARDASAEPAL